MPEPQREGVLVTPHCRLSEAQIRVVEGVSRDLLGDPGVLCHNAEAAGIFRAAGAEVEDAGGVPRLRIAPSLLDRALETAPSKIVLGARDRPAY